MERKLRDKLPTVEFSGEQVTEGYWQQQLREGDARSKLRQKEYADRTRGAKYSDIGSRDKVLLKQARDSKLSPNFEPEPYTHSNIVTARVLPRGKHATYAFQFTQVGRFQGDRGKVNITNKRANRGIKYILLTKREGRTGRISARGLDSTDRAQRGPYKKDRGPIFS